MRLQEHIRKVLKEETYFKISDDKYSKLIKNAVLNYVDFNICTLVVSALESIEDQYLVILITDEQLKSYYREELQEYLNNYIPLKSIYVSVSDGQDCQNYRKNMNLQEQIRKVLKEYLNESDPKVGTGKKPKDSDRRLYTDENPNDTVSVKFRTKQDIVDTLNKESFKSKSHARQSQIINLIHQRLRVALERAKDPEVKKRLRTAFEYIESKKEASKRKTEEMKEGELTERCWKGYTQKGMKTMFGKRYPNCVKKKK
jgi:hypothetical protein